MKEIALQTARQAGEQKLNVLREYLQNYLLFFSSKIRNELPSFFRGRDRPALSLWNPAIF